MATIKINGELYHNRGIRGRPLHEVRQSAAKARKEGHKTKILTDNELGGWTLWVSAKRIQKSGKFDYNPFGM